MQMYAMQREAEQPTPEAAMRLVPAHIDNAVDIFSGDDQYGVRSFVADFEMVAEQFGWSDGLKAIFVKKYIRGTAKAFLRVFNHALTWNEIKDELMAEFGTSVSAADVHKKLANRKKLSTESPQQYVIAMREISIGGNVTEPDLVNYIISGLAQDKSERLFFAGATSLAELRTLLARFQETVHRTFSGTSLQLQPSATVSNNWRSMNRTTVEIKQQDIRQQQPGNMQMQNTNPSVHVKCFNCNEFGHISAACGKPRRPLNGCFRCGDSGHRVADCPMRAMPIKQEIANIISSDPEYEFYETVSFSLFNKLSETKISVQALLDTGSPVSFVQSKFIPPVFMENICNVHTAFVGINGSRMDIIGKVSVSMVVRNYMPVQMQILVVRNDTMRSAAILGRDFIGRYGLRLIPSRNESKSEKNKEEPRSEFENELSELMAIETDDGAAEFEVDVNPVLTKAYSRVIKSLIKECQVRKGEPLISSPIEMTIRLSKEPSFYCAPRRLSYLEKEKVRIILDDLLEQQIIRPSNSEFTSPIVLARKKDGSVRMCVDYREVNKITLRDNYPLPLIEDQIDSLHGKRFFSSLDLKDGFHHVRMSEESIKYTSFVTPLGQFEYLRMPFGLKNAPSVFQRYINSIFRELIDANEVQIYMDDILIATASLEEHMRILAEVFRLIKVHSLSLKLSKCKFVFEEIDYLGYRVSAAGIKPNPQTIEAVEGFPVPKSTRDVRSFLGLCSYFRKFVQGFATIAKPLFDLLRKDADFKFEAAEIEVFNHLKKILLSSPVLALFSPTDETELHCDASSLGYGAILLQRKEDKQWHPVFYFSKRTTDAESRYHSFELETLAIVNALRRFRTYLQGVPFTIVTDCNSLASTLQKKQINHRIHRWALELIDYDFKIVHRGGDRMRHVDALSRSYEAMVVEPISFEHALAVEQGRDPILAKLRTELEGKVSNSFEMQEGLVYKKIESDKLLFYVPDSMEDNVIRSCHDEMGHFGVEKVTALIRKQYWFPSMKSKVESYIRKCLVCIQFAPNSGRVEGELHSIPKGKVPFDTLHIDHLGPLESTRQKHKHIFLIVDAFTKFVKMFAVRTTSSKEAISCLTTYFHTFSRPLRIVSDRGTCFTSKEFADFVDKLNIQHIKIASASPQSNGQAERMNRIITPMLAKISEPDAWNKHLLEVEFAMNNTLSRSTGFSPGKLLFGVEQRGKVCDKIREYLSSKEEIVRDLATFRDEAAAKLESEQLKNKSRFDSKHKTPNRYSVADLVMVSNYDTTPGVNKKLLPKYRGPYRVEQVFPNDRYLVKDVDNWQVTQRPYEGIHAPAQMRPWLPPQE